MGVYVSKTNQKKAAIPVRLLRDAKSDKRKSATSTIFLRGGDWYEKAALSISAVKNFDTPRNRTSYGQILVTAGAGQAAAVAG